jgi:hypothetical protein
MQRKLALTAVLAVALAITGYAQKKPDFSGSWTVDQAATDAANPAPAGGGAGGGGARGGGRGMGAGPMTIKQTADALTIERQGPNGAMSTVYKLDGTESEITMGRGTVKAKAKVEGDKIVIEQTRTGQDGTPVTSTITYSMDDKGMLWVENKTPNGGRKTAYKKTT